MQLTDQNTIHFEIVAAFGQVLLWWASPLFSFPQAAHQGSGVH